MARITLPRGQWAEIRERLSHGQAKDLRRAWIRGRAEPEEKVEVQSAYARAFVRDWNVVDIDGNPIPLTDPGAIDRAPDDVIDAIFDQVLPAESKATDPKAPTSGPSITPRPEVDSAATPSEAPTST